jgi:DNA-binding transcriptional regulator LsrR (DeoR family)
MAKQPPFQPDLTPFESGTGAMESAHAIPPAKIAETSQSHPDSSAVPSQDANDDESQRQRLLSLYRQYLQDEKISLQKIGNRLGLSKRDLLANLRAAFQAGAIVVHTPENKELRDRMNQAWGGPRYHVLNSVDEPTFSSGAADVFFSELDSLLVKRPYNVDKPLHIGIVGGQTTGEMINALCGAASWQNRFKSDSLPKAIKVYALNVSQTIGIRELSGNANILAHQLAKKLKEELTQLNIEVDVHGLSTDLLQLKEEAQRSDIKPTTRRVLQQTDPNRLRASLESQKQSVPQTLAQESELDVVITGVGSIRSSLFKDYCQQSGFDPDELVRSEKIVGDIAYCPVNLLGEPQQMIRDGQEYIFYSAVSLEVLSRMAASPYKKVILVARNSGDRNKVDPIHAAIGGKIPHCNVLITDRFTCDQLLKKHGISSE